MRLRAGVLLAWVGLVVARVAAFPQLRDQQNEPNDDGDDAKGQNGWKREDLNEQLGDNIHAMRLVKVQPLSDQDQRKVRVLCWVNTFHANHKSRLVPIRDTWGQKCDKILFMSDVEDPSIPTVRIQSQPLHETLWQKHREIVRILVREFKEGAYDWVFKCDDDTFLIVENLKSYLLSDEIQRLVAQDKHKPIILGHRMTLPWWEMERPFLPHDEHHPDRLAAMLKVQDETKATGGLHYTPGGGGYAMNWAYLTKLASIFNETWCLPNEIIPDDWAISFCMYHLGVFPTDTRDNQKRERFHQYVPKELFFKPHDPNAYDKELFDSIYDDNNWFSDHNGIGWQNGVDCCAPDSISFHYVKPPLMQLFYEFYYGTS